MTGFVEEYSAYEKVMHDHDVNAENESLLQPAKDFICERHEGLYCMLDDDYAPTGTVTAEGVDKYLEMLAYRKPSLTAK